MTLQLVEGEVPAVKDEAHAGKNDPDGPERGQPPVTLAFNDTRGGR